MILPDHTAIAGMSDDFVQLMPKRSGCLVYVAKIHSTLLHERYGKLRHPPSFQQRDRF